MSVPDDSLQSHLYASFLHAHTADVQLHIYGHWEAVYHLHRVVLIQAGFFHNLFTAGFRETNKGSHLTRDEVTVRFDDTNITRPGKICIARLYGGGPQLYLSPSIVPSPTFPLTSAFHSPGKQHQTPPNHHPASPRFLLSLLATSIYLSMPSITSQALSMVLSSIGPYTVHRYLDFAIGQGIGPPESNDPMAAVGLEGVAKEVKYLSGDFNCTTSSIQHKDALDPDVDPDITCKLSSLDLEGSEKNMSATDSQLQESTFNYGVFGDKVGEACACWLTRWGADMLPYDEAAANYTVASDSSSRPPPPPAAEAVVPRLWTRDGLTPAWVRAVISSNDFFIKDELERYDFAKRVVDLRRRDGLDPDEEKEWLPLFRRGIYYSHMLLEDLIRISRDMSPITGQAYVPIDVIHYAHWEQSLLRHSILRRSPVSGSASPPLSRDKELGISLSTAEILTSISSDHVSDAEKSKPYYPVPTDSSQYIGGDSDDGDGAMNQAHFFGILSRRYTAASCVQADTTGKARWTPHAPIRFAVQLWGVAQLPEKSRLYSHTVWYAGSLFNVYIQVVRKKGVQLGVYLHRQSCVDPVPRASAPPPALLPSPERAPETTPQPQTPTASVRPRGPSIASSNSATFPVAVPGSPASLPSSPTRLHRELPTPTAYVQQYRDPRAVVSAHFTISCASATGSSLTRFSSAPDQFAVNQSWGWKSSSSRTEEYIEVQRPDIDAPECKETSLRATVVLGLT